MLSPPRGSGLPLSGPPPQGWACTLAWCCSSSQRVKIDGRVARAQGPRRGPHAHVTGAQVGAVVVVQRGQGGR